MPRKPSSLFVLVEPPVSLYGSNPPPAQAYRYRLDDNTTLEQIVEAEYHRHPAGSLIYVIEDTKVDAHRVGLHLDAVDDARLQDQEEG